MMGWSSGQHHLDTTSVDGKPLRGKTNSPPRSTTADLEALSVSKFQIPSGQVIIIAFSGKRCLEKPISGMPKGHDFDLCKEAEGPLDSRRATMHHARERNGKAL